MRSRLLVLSAGVGLVLAMAVGGVPGRAAAASLSPRAPSAGDTFRPCGPAATGDARCSVIVLRDPAENWVGITENAKPGKGPGHGGGGGGGGTTTPSGYSPQNLLSAYNLASAAAEDGGSETVAVVDAYNDPYALSDLETYRSQFNLPACSDTALYGSSGCLRIVNETGGSSLPRGNTGWGTEISLDLDMVSAICPNCHIVLVEASSTSLADLGTAAAYAGTVANVVSNSYGGSESSTELNYNTDYEASGVVYTASAGDSGYGVEFPAADPYVVAVGGTTLTEDSSTTRGWEETVWSDSGSGCSSYEPEPAWQPSSTGLCTDRTVADVAADANPNTGVAIYDTYGESGWIVVGGTSVASPLVASVFALAGNGASFPEGQAAKGLYASSASLYKVTSGSNSSGCTNYLCNAADSLSSGYNGPTGNGTPNGTGAF